MFENHLSLRLTILTRYFGKLCGFYAAHGVFILIWNKVEIILTERENKKILNGRQP